MLSIKRQGLLLGAAAMLSVAAPISIFSAQELDRATGLIVEPGWQAVQANCTTCHSALLITQNSGNRAVWESRIVWMQETQGMPALDAGLEDTILGYLARHYGQKQSSRRAPLPPHLSPENPYATGN